MILKIRKLDIILFERYNLPYEFEVVDMSDSMEKMNQTSKERATLPRKLLNFFLGRKVVLRPDKQGGWFEIPYSFWMENGKAVHYLKDGRICEEAQYVNGKITERRERFWDDISLNAFQNNAGILEKINRRSPDYLDRVYKDGKLIKEERLFRGTYTVTPIENDQKEGIQEVYTRMSGLDDSVSDSSKIKGSFYLSETNEYHNGVLNGMVCRYHPNGQLAYEGIFCTEKNSFMLTEKDADNIRARHPERVKTLVDESGRMIYVHELMVKRPVGEHKQYYPNGKMKSFQFTKDGVVDYTEFDEMGEVCFARRSGKDIEANYLKDEGIYVSFEDGHGTFGVVEIQKDGSRQARHEDKDKKSNSYKSSALDGFYTYVNENSEVVEELYKDSLLKQRVVYKDGKAVSAQKIDKAGNATDFPVSQRIKPSKLLQIFKQLESESKEIKMKQTQRLPIELFDQHVDKSETNIQTDTSVLQGKIIRLAYKKGKSR